MTTQFFFFFTDSIPNSFLCKWKISLKHTTQVTFGAVPILLPIAADNINYISTIKEDMLSERNQLLVMGDNRKLEAKPLSFDICPGMMSTRANSPR